jgi:Mn-dependent DtxR family transcriptional regulator
LTQAIGPTDFPWVPDNPISDTGTPRTTAAVEDYLERIRDLIRSKGYARVVDIAAELKISQASVTTMIQRLDAEGLVKYEKYRGMVLTRAGEAVATRIAHRHELLTTFLRQLNLPEDVIEHDVEGLEHHVSPQTFSAIEALSRHLAANPEISRQLTQFRPDI